MERLAEIWRRLLFLFRRRQFDRDLEEEMRFHVEMKARESGAAAARQEFGNATLWREDCRQAWAWSALERAVQDVRYAARTLRKAPGFTAVVVLTLALGIGVNTAIFSLVDRLLLRPLPFPESERLATLYFRESSYPVPYNSLSYPDYVYYRDNNQVFSGLAAYTEINVSVRMGDDDETVAGEIVTANYFDVLGVKPKWGRGFRTDEDRVPGRDAVVMVSEEFRERRLGGAAGVLGRQIKINGTNFTVIGMVPRGFAGLQLDRQSKPELWVPIMAYPAIFAWGREWDLEHLRGDDWLSATARIRAGTSMRQASAQIAQLTERLKPVWRAENLDNGKASGLLIPANQSRFPPDSRHSLTMYLAMLMAVVGLVLLIACTNVASLLLARAVKRRREIGVRVALGAGRARLAQQLMSEGLLLSLAGGATGIAVAFLVQRFLSGIERPFHMPLLLDSGIDGPILIFAAALSTLTGILFGLLPLRQAARLNVTPMLKGETRVTGRRVFGLRNLLVVIQVALSLVLLAGAGLFVRTLRNAQAADITKDPDNVLLFNVGYFARYSFKDNAARAKEFYATLLDRIHGIAGVRTAAYVMVVPFGGRRGGTNIVPYPGAKPVQVDFNAVSPEYFETVGIPVERGRQFNDYDRAGAPNVVIVNKQMAKRFWPGEDPIGKRIEVGYPERMAEVVGVVRDGKFRGYREAVHPCFYAPLAQMETLDLSLEVRAAPHAPWLAAAVRREMRGLDKDLQIPEAQTLRSFRDSGLGQERLSAALLSGLGILAAVIAAVGLYGVLAFAVAQRTREIGIRMALGAAPRQVLRGVLAEALALVGAGLAIGFLAAVALARFIASLLYGISPTDLATYAVSAALLAAVGVAAAYLPARRASRVDPMVALRYE